ncbi:MAG: hypothetical protein EZS28_035292, partial [Streblomastix strix]
MEDIIITIDLKAGTYIEPRIRIISERMTMKGEGIQNTIIRNDITSEDKTSCLLSIEPDNTECKLDINDIAFEQQNYGSINDDALIMIYYGEVRLQSCSFRQTDLSIQHNTPYIRIKQKQVALSGISISNSNFSYNTAAIEVIPGGGVILNGCNFTNIIGAASISAVISEIQSDLIMYNCKFLNCQSYSGSIPSGSTISISSTFQQDFSNNIVQSILKSPACIFTQCQFTGNTGQVNSEIQFLAVNGLIVIWMKSNPIIYNETTNSTHSSVNFLGNTEGTEKLDQLLLTNIDQRLFIFYVALTGNDLNTGSKLSPLRMISHAIAMLNRSAGYKEIFIMKGVFDEPQIVSRDITYILTGLGSHATSLCNSKTEENCILWLERGSNIMVQDCTMFKYSEISITARMIDCDPWSRIIVRRCVMFNDVTAEFGVKFNAGLLSVVFTSGGIFDSVFQNSQMTNSDSIRIGSQTDDFDFDLIEKNSDGSCQFVSDDAEPENNPPQVLFEFYNVTFRHLSSNEPSTPSVDIFS